MLLTTPIPWDPLSFSRLTPRGVREQRQSSVSDDRRALAAAAAGAAVRDDRGRLVLGEALGRLELRGVRLLETV